MMVLCQYRAVLVGTRWNWVSRRRYWLVLGGTGSLKGAVSVQGGTGWYLMVLFNDEPH